MEITHANLTDYIVIGLYGLLMVVVGIYVMRFNRGASEYFRGGSRIPWLVAGLSCFMSGFSAWTFTGAAGVAYRAGFAATGLYIGNALSFLLGYFVFADRWRRSRITTVMEYLSARFNFVTHQTFSWSTILFQLFMSASMLYGLSVFVSSACGLSGGMDHPDCRLSHNFLLHDRRTLGSSRYRFSTSLNLDAILFGSRHHFSGARRRRCRLLFILSRSR